MKRLNITIWEVENGYVVLEDYRPASQNCPVKYVAQSIFQLCEVVSKLAELTLKEGPDKIDKGEG